MVERRGTIVSVLRSRARLLGGSDHRIQESRSIASRRVCVCVYVGTIRLDQSGSAQMEWGGGWEPVDVYETELKFTPLARLEPPGISHTHIRRCFLPFGFVRLELFESPNGMLQQQETGVKRAYRYSQETEHELGMTCDPLVQDDIFSHLEKGQCP